MTHSHYSLTLSFILALFFILQVSSSSLRTGSGARHHKDNYRYLCMGDEKEDGSKTVKHLGIACNCPSIYAPVCGSDNVTYHNRCFMHCKAKHAKDLYHKTRLVLKKLEKC